MAMIDGTAPHVYEPALPGAKENIVDLGAYWNEDMLRSKKDEIQTLVTAKKQCFKTAYSYLSAVGAADRIKENIICKYIKRDTMLPISAAWLSELKPPRNGSSCIRLVSSLGMKGRVKFDTFENIASQSVILRDSFGIGYIFLDALKNESEKLGIPVAVSYDPIFKDRINNLLLGETVAVSLSQISGDERLGDLIKDIPEHAVKEIEELENQSENLESHAVEYLQKASDIHFEIEKIYVSAMDFEKKEAFTESFISTHI